METQDEWKLFVPDQNIIYTISVFDDGNEQYKFYANEWYKYGSWRGKIALVNRHNAEIMIPSISEWKTCSTTCSITCSAA